MQESNLKTLSNSEDPLSISNCKFLTHFSNNSPVLIFGPKLSSSGRKSIDCNYKPSDIDSYDSIIKIPSNDLSKNNHLPIFDNRRSNYSSNGSKKNLRVNTSEVNYSQDQSFINFNENEKKKDEIAEKNEKDNHKKYERYLDNIYFNLFITLITIYALFGSDIQAVFFTLEADVTFDSMTLVSFLIFIIEIILSFAFRKDYRFAFFFWLDIISTCSLLMDVTWVQDALFLDSNTSSTAHLARASRASRFGTRAGRILRMLRLIRIVKLYKSAIITKNQKEKLKSLEITKTKLLEKKKTMMFDRSNSLKSCSPEKKTQKWYMSPSASPKRFSPKRSNKGINNGFQLKIKKGVEVVSIITPQQERISVAYSNDGNRYFADNTQKIDEIELLNQIEEEIHLKESKVGKKLGGLTIKRIIILVLLLIMVIPLMQAAYWNDPTQCHELGIKVLLNMIQNNVTNSEISRYCQVLIETCTKSNSIYPLIYLSTPLTDINCTYSTMDPSLLRGSEKMEAALDYLPNNIVAVLDYRYNSIYNGVIDILRNIFICVVLTIASLLITRDANELVILPIERLIQKVNKLAENPLSIKDQRLLVDQDSDKKELVVIENSIIKIATLLALGYGEAGAEIIGAQMAKNGQMDYALKGKKLYGIFGFCDIRNFTDATEVLQQDVMLFVNNIAEIVHSIVDRYGGSANKNIGDAFLLVWKFNENVGYFLEEEEQQLIPKTNKRVNDFCDLALISFSKIIAKINRAPKILNYRTDPRLCDRIKGYKVKMGFGLHLGWAIEGAIGSTYKIDASYLSPHVNIASRLEAATKQYGVPLLISEHIFRYFSPRLQAICRKIDCVALKGSHESLGLFTLDLDVENLPPSKNKENISKDEITEMNWIKKNAFFEGLEVGAFEVEEVLDNDKAMKMMLKTFNINFHEVFKRGMEYYIQGNWIKAKEKFEEGLIKKIDDGPCKTLLVFMQKSFFIKPEDWKGFRELTEK